MRTAFNCWTFRNVDASLPAVVERGAAAGFDGVQFSGGLWDATPDDLRRTLDETGLAATAPHVDIDALESDLDGVVGTYDPLGCDGFVVPYLDASHFESERALDATAARLTDAAAAARERGYDLHYHNHDAEFAALDGGVAFDALLDRTAFPVELDVGWVRAAGHDPVAYLERLDGRCELVHMRDVDADGGDAELGAGVVDLAACAAAAREVGAEWLIYERIDPDYPASLDRAADVLGSL